ncbi:hypothetical protein LguiB_021457 [Lonicera macranthoides]
MVFGDPTTGSSCVLDMMFPKMSWSFSPNLRVIGVRKGPSYCLINDARQLFDEMSNRMVVDWNLMISGYWNWRNEVEAQEAVELFGDMMNALIQPDDTS